MALRRVDTARLMFEPAVISGRGWVLLVIGRRAVRLGTRKLHKRDFADAQALQRQVPTYLGAFDGRHYWQYTGRIYSETDGLGAKEVHALLVARDQRERRKVDRAVAMLERHDAPENPGRGAIPDDVKQYVFQRDGGRCRNCGSTTELQFDHIIPVAMGGSSEPENLQILCGPCNRWALTDGSFHVIEAKNRVDEKHPVYKKHAEQLSNAMDWFRQTYGAKATAVPVLVHARAMFDKKAAVPTGCRVVTKEKLEALRDALHAYATALADADTFRPDLAQVSAQRVVS